MPYRVNEMFYSLQGEGVRAGTAAVFCRFSGCNLWSGDEASRADAVCTFCDTQFMGTGGEGGGTFQTAQELTSELASFWQSTSKASEGAKWVVLTGGEPTLQADDELVMALHAGGFRVAMESNGTRLPPAGLDWLTVSPKAGTKLVCTAGNELKLVFPQAELPPASLEALEFEFFLLQPMDGPEVLQNTEECVRYCLQHPRWRLSLQTHKHLGIR